ncbi:hypothetical protein ACFXPS_21675 [Nocardia sp. NPDC059091]|uniref:hypothetical protein n=1 Tax=unclassified Nocardia TaxID=2637762 RepID=UPI00369CA6C8
MSGETDGQDIDPEKTTSSGDWWQGPVHERPQPSPPPPHPHPSPNPQASGPNPIPGPGPASGPGPWPGPNPYQSGPNSYQSSPYRSGPNPVPPSANSYSTGASPFAAGQPGGFGPPPGGNRGRVWLLAGAGALVVAIVAVVAIVIVMHDSGKGPTPTAAKPTSITSAPATTPRTTTAPASTLTPQIPGYQVDVPKDLKAAWDIPSDWKTDLTATTYGNGTDSIPAAGFAEEGSDYCPSNVRTTMFLSTSDVSDATAAATDVGAHAARIGYTTKTSLTAGTAQPLDTSDGQLHGTFLETSGGFTAPAGCATGYSVYTFALSVGAGKGSLVLVILADTGVDRSVTADFARKLFATFRLL